MGMLSYFSTERVTGTGVSFNPIEIGDNVSVGQRCVFLSGADLGAQCTVGAETVIPHDYHVYRGETTFGSPPVRFKSGLSRRDSVLQTQNSARELRRASLSGSGTIELDASSQTRTSFSSDATFPKGDGSTKQPTISRRQDIGKGHFWTYVLAMLTLQALMPVAVGGSYALLFYIATLVFEDINAQHVILAAPVIYALGSMLLMFLLKMIQTIGGGFSHGTSNFFSFKFFYWHIFADMVSLIAHYV